MDSAYECYWLGVWPSLAPEKIMVVDDGSTDRTLAGRQFESSEVQMVTQPNQGSGAITSISLTEAKRIRYVGRDGSKLSTIELKKFCSENLPLDTLPEFFCARILLKISTDKVDYQKLKV